MEIDFIELISNGCMRIRSVLDPEQLAEFEHDISKFAETVAARRGIVRQSEDAMTDLLRAGGQYRRLLFPQLKNLRSLRAMEHKVAQSLEDIDFFRWAEMRTPTVHSLFKADVPGEMKYLLPMHQDYNTPCHNAWRAWVPLRAAYEANGTMRYVPGSHKRGFVQHDDSDPERPQVGPQNYAANEVRLLELNSGDAFLFHPLLIHSSVPATAERMKYALIVNFWDIDTLADPDDPADPIFARMEMGRMRDAARGDRSPIAPARSSETTS